MTDARRIRSAALAVACFGAIAAAHGCRRAERRVPWVWFEGTVDEALSAARAENGLVLVEVSAGWCPTCRQLERDVFGRGAGALPRGTMIGVRVDFDSPEGQAFARRHRVIGLPTTVVLAPDGTEKGRVEGYDDVASYVEGIRRAEAGIDDLPELLGKAAAAPDAPRLAAAAGAAQLARGDETEGLRLLESARRLDPGNEAGAWEDATRTLGRYFARVRGDLDAALRYFREGADVTAQTDAAWGFRYWVAMILEQAGRHDEAVAFLDDLISAHRGLAEPAALKAEFLYMNRSDDETALELALDAAGINPVDDWDQYLVGVLAERLGRKDVARAAAGRAVALAPGKAIYEELLERLDAAATGASPAGR